MKIIQKSVVCFIFILASTVARKLELLELSVPSTVDIHDNVTLSCRFDLGGERLYSVKWYKDEFEFYRFIPDYIPPCQSLSVPGVTLLSEARCSMENVTLTQLTFTSSGVYRCEVSTEAPNFQTVYRNSNMTVIALPVEDPMIEGVLTTYSLGEHVRATCTSAKSNPPSILTWYINGVKADPWLLDHSPAAQEVDAQGLHTRSLGLNFVTERRFFRGSAGEMELRCTASIGERSWSKRVISTLSTLTNLKLAQERLGNNEAARPMTPYAPLASLVVLMCYLLGTMS